MAVSTDTETYSCSQCGDSFPAAAAIKGSFCSSECVDRHRAEKEATRILNQLQYDHRFCFTCFRQLKDVYLPESRWGIPDCFRGFQHRTKYAENGQKVVIKPTYHNLDLDDDRGLVTTGIICCCGNTSHQHCERAIRDHRIFECAYYLTESLQILRAEEKIEHDINADQLFDSLLERHSIATSIADAIRMKEQ